MIQGDFVGLVELVSGLPVRIGHPKLFLLIVIFEGFVMSSRLQQVPVAEGEVSGGDRGFKRSDYLFIVFLNCTTLPGWQAVISPFILRHRGDGSVNVIGLTGSILGVLANERP